jgi:hypothetical protein
MTNIDFLIRSAVAVIGFIAYIITLKKTLGREIIKDNLFWLFLGYLLILSEIN